MGRRVIDQRFLIGLVLASLVMLAGLTIVFFTSDPQPEVASNPTPCSQANFEQGTNESTIGVIGELCKAGLQVMGSCKLTSQSSTVTCTTFTTPTGTSTYAIPCYVTATGVVNHATCQVAYTEANTGASVTLTLVTATNLNTVYTAEDIIWVAPSTTITLSLQVTSGTFNIAGAIIRET